MSTAGDRRVRHPVMTTPGFLGLSAAGRPRRHAQSRAGRADGDLRFGGGGADRRRGGADRRRAAAPRRLRPARARHAAHARDARGILRPSERRCGAGRGARMRAGDRAAPGRGGAACRQAGRDPGDPDRGGHASARPRRDRDRAGDGRAARQPGARVVRRRASRAVAEMRRLGLHLRPGLESDARTGRRPLVDLGGSRGAWRDCRDHGGGAPAGLACDPAGDVGDADPGDHPRRDGGARARARHPRHAAVARQHSRRADDDRREVAGRDAQGRERAPLEDVGRLRRAESAARV